MEAHSPVATGSVSSWRNPNTPMKHLLPIAAAIASLFVTTVHPQSITSTRLDLPPYDPSFDDDGFLAEGSGPDGIDRIEDVAVLGTRLFGVGAAGGSLWISCRNEDGSPDSDFGDLGNGRFETDIDPHSPKIVASRTHDRILVGDTGHLDFLALQRLDAVTGTPDTDFGENGRARFHLEFGIHDLEELELTDLALDEAREKIYLAVRGRSPSHGKFTCLVRLHWDGTFNGTGYRTGTFVGSTSLRESLEVTDAQLDGTGNLVLVGHRADEERNQYLGVARLTSSGALDAAYSINGSAQFDLHSNCWRIGSTSVAVDDHDRIVVGGWRLDDELSADQGLLLRSVD